MNAHRRDGPGHDPSPRNPRYERWFDGTLAPEESEAVGREVAADPRLSTGYAADCAIEASLRRSFGGGRPVRLRPTLQHLRGMRAPRRGAAAAAALIALGSLGWFAARETPRKNSPDGTTTARAPIAVRPAAAPCELGDVFLDALAVEFQPLVGCRIRDDWNARLLAELASAPCSREEAVVVLGEWIDPRVDADNLVLLRHGDDPIMLVVPDCDRDAELCVPKDSGLYVHRGLRDGRPIYEVSPLPGSEVLACVDARNVITQPQD